jgi:hypothetical protein
MRFPCPGRLLSPLPGLSLALAALLPAASAQVAATRPPQGEHRLLLFPQPGRLDAQGRVLARVEAWIYETEHRPGASALLARYLELDLDALDAAGRERFLHRTQLFRVDSERRKRLHLRFEDGTQALSPRSRGNGRISLELRLDQPAPAVAQPRWIGYHARLDDQGPEASGRVLLLPERGLSVVSDIDDTIKDSNVLDRHELLLNTFVREFRAVPGMAARYRRIVAGDPGASFHYLSGSPIQLYPALADFLANEGFPPGSLHLRDVDLSDELFGRSEGTPGHKLAVLRRLLAEHPHRRFLLVGDSGEQDPETYGEIARESPRQIAGIAIRDVTGQARDDARYAAAFSGVDPRLWRIVADAGQIPLDHREGLACDAACTGAKR